MARYERFTRFTLPVTAAMLVSFVVVGCAQTAPPSPATAPAKPAAEPTKAPSVGAPTTAPAAPAATAAPAAGQPVKIGVLFPLTGGAAGIGLDNKYATDLAVEIVNGKFDLDLPLAKTEGLPNLGGTKVSVVYSDHQAQPEKGQSEAERLVLQEKVTALLGAYYSSVTLTASQTAERLGIPMVNGDSSSPTLTERGLKWFFRTGPHDGVFVRNFFDLLDDVKKQKNLSIKTVAIVNENTLAGNDFNKNSKKLAQERGYSVVADILYPQNTPEVTSEVQRLKAANPDVVLQLSYTAEAVLFVKAYKQMDFNPQNVLAYGAGFTDPKFFEVLGRDSQYYVSKATFSPDAADKKPAAKAVAEMFQKKYGQPMTENSGRNFDAMITLLDAINRAKSTDPKAIQKALTETNIPESQTIMPYAGVKFGPDGQNQGARSLITQVFGGIHYTVWPFTQGTKELVWPRPKWSDIK